jgi:hypothetical protein
MVGSVVYTRATVGILLLLVLFCAYCRGARGPRLRTRAYTRTVRVPGTSTHYQVQYSGTVKQ